MFDVDVASIIEGPLIDRPCNALTLTRDWHELFGNFNVYFELVDKDTHTYQIKRHEDYPPWLREELKPDLPVTRSLFLTPDRTIEPPLPRLLAIHRAISHILHLSGAGEYIDKIYRDMDENSVREDGSTPLGSLVTAAFSLKHLPVYT
jgi:hypothetical protein